MALAILAGLLGWVSKGSIGLGLAIGVDPAVSSAVFATTVTNVFGFLIFLTAGGVLVRALE